ncbi:hypothetical protein [Chryseobacterium indoltheticum]|uniref:hypothetical protein n=1 Tax=Chryseobacterium indoltheticum TaxID=254 RepID=UPI003F4970C8
MTCTATTSGNTLGSSMPVPATPCFGAPNDDVWYKFVATSSSHLVHPLSNVVSTGIMRQDNGRCIFRYYLGLVVL